MKDEIKEILDEMIDNEKLINVENDYERIIFEYLANNCSEFDDEHIKQLVNLKVEQYKQLLDYKTNLQEENKELLDKVRDREKIIVENVQLKRDRIDKAIKKLKDTNVDMPSTLLIEVIDYAVHILQGSDKEWNK